MTVVWTPGINGDLMMFNGDLLGIIVDLPLWKRLEFVSSDDDIPNNDMEK